MLSLQSSLKHVLASAMTSKEFCFKKLFILAFFTTFVLFHFNAEVSSLNKVEIILTPSFSHNRYYNLVEN